MNYFSSKPEEKRESPSMKVRRDISPFIANYKMKDERKFLRQNKKTSP